MIVCLHSTRYKRLRLEMPDLYERVYTLCDKHCVILVWERDYLSGGCDAFKLSTVALISRGN